MMGCSPSKSVSDPHLSDKDRQAQTTVQEVEKAGSGKNHDSDNLSTDDDTSQKLSQKELSADSNNKDSFNNRFKQEGDTEKLNSINRIRAQPPTSGVLATTPNIKTGNNRNISQSQTEFFQMLDEKIERGRDYALEEDVT
ncbi:uncharacterized protein C1orf21-like isoform X1 [Ptychodera flava]|uniref:uncharacterized protein C1orf21-like isoform X1 n=1 Tax=Ptychodera flava TaxID=63121 RepID=UPI003969DF17